MYMKYDPLPPRPHRPALVERSMLVVFIALTLGVGLVGSLATAAGQDGWYQALVKPPLNPPDGVFGPVWTTLYVLMAVAAWRIWRQPPYRPPGPPSRSRALTLWGIQLGLNLLWSVLFFALKSPVAALGDLVVMLMVLVAAAWGFWRRDRWAGALMAPAVAWVAFAGYLNAGIVVVN